MLKRLFAGIHTLVSSKSARSFITAPWSAFAWLPYLLFISYVYFYCFLCLMLISVSAKAKKIVLIRIKKLLSLWSAFMWQTILSAAFKNILQLTRTVTSLLDMKTRKLGLRTFCDKNLRNTIRKEERVRTLLIKNQKNSTCCRAFQIKIET